MCDPRPPAPGRRRTVWRAGLVALLAASALSASVEPSAAVTAGMREFPAAGTFTFVVPLDVTGLHVDAWGAGGGGSGAILDGGPPPSGFSRSGIGGGGGGYVHGALTVLPGQRITITVGAAGTGGPVGEGSAPNTEGTTGGATSVSRGGTELMRADGGKGAGVFPATPAGGVAPAPTALGGGGVVRPGSRPGGTGGQTGPGQAPSDVLRTPGCGDGGAGGSYVDFTDQGSPGSSGQPGCLVVSWT
ncbi:glycine-rich domain-containing protein [Kitasatospora purpeofusca]|uniref:glycine-rich domain-containing protein n=2 Tax=Kitasatospora purpeofusca TaxID=67352 RepID=UPI0035DC2282